MNTLPKGFMASSETPTCVVTGVDFEIVVAFWEGKAEPLFNRHMQEAYDANNGAGIPCIALVQVDASPYLELVSLNNPQWPSPERDPYLKVLDPLFLVPAKTSTYKFHAIMLDVREMSQPGVTPDWACAVAQHLSEIFKEHYFGKPIYILTDESVMQEFPDASKNPQVFLSKQTMLCTHSVTEKPYPNWGNMKFWWRGSQLFDFLDKIRVPVFQYQGTLAMMYKELSFTPKAVATEPISEIPVQTAPSKNEQVIALLQQAIDVLKEE